MGDQGSTNKLAPYGAALTSKQFITLVTAIALGTMLEWYDFFVYAQLNSYLTKVFFPSNDPAVQQLSYWGVYAVGFIARPVGSIIFGHIGDTRGRRLNLLLTITIMAVPTVLIGCLPTFGHVGIAAPALLAVLRLIQGLAMGGEFGSAMVYLHEIAPANMKGTIGSLGFVSSMFGCTLGVLMVVIMEAMFNPSQMLLFGWRIPFLLASVNASAAIALRMHMPEPNEFVEERQTVIQRHLDKIASRRSSSGGGDVRQLSSRFRDSLTKHMGTVRSLSIQDSMVIIPADQDAAAPHQKHRNSDLETGIKLSDPAPGSFGPADQILSKETSVPLAAADVQEKQREYVPIIRLLRKHAPAVLLQCLFEAWVSIGFWVITTWLPVQMKKAPINMPEILTQAMLIVNLMVMGVVQLSTGWLSDRGMPRVWFCFGVFTVAAAISCPVLIEMPRAGIAGAWLLHTLLMVILACVLGVIPATMSPIYPTTVRATGFNLGHNMAMSWLGGVSPTVVTALVAATGRTFLAPGLLLTAAAGVSMLAALVLVKYAPQANGNSQKYTPQPDSS